MGESDERVAVIREAATWLGTPFHHGAFIKGAGADCRFISKVFESLALAPPDAAAEFHPIDWHLNQGREYYLEGLAPYAVEIDGPGEPADIVLWKFGRCFSHAALVVAWPTIIHTIRKLPVQYDDAERLVDLVWLGDRPRPRKFFRLKAWVAR